MTRRFAVHVLFYNVHKSILQMIDNAAPFVEKIYVSYSEIPWNYNVEARRQFRNKSGLDILRESKHFDKIELVTGVWSSEEEQRNACLDRAQDDGMDFLIVQDADEFYKIDDFRQLILDIEREPEHDAYLAPCCTFWKSWNTVLVDDKGAPALTYLTVAINCRNENARFSSLRQVSTSDYLVIHVLFYHGSYVLTDDEVYEKISTWGHSLDFNRDEWYQHKWLNWSDEVTNLHPTHPTVWTRARPFAGTLPEILQGDQPVVESYGVISPQELYEYGALFTVHSILREAVKFMEMFLGISSNDAEKNVDACFKLMILYDTLGENSKAVETALRSFKYNSPKAEFCMRLSSYFYGVGDINASIFWSELATIIPRPTHVLSLDHWTWVPHYQLCLCHQQLGNNDKAFWHNNEALKYKPDDDRLIENQKYFAEVGYS